MASVDLENLTDSEIRSKFVELGQNIGPVTSTTRKLYLKKLKTLLDGSGSAANLNSSYPRNNAHNSADDESDSGSPKSRRRSMPPPRTNKSPTRRKSPNRASLNNNALANSTFLDQRNAEVDGYSSRTYSSLNEYETKRPTRSSLGLNNSSRSQGIYGDVDESELDVSLSRPTLSQSNKENYKVTNSSPTKFTSPDLGIGLSDTFKSRLQASGSTSFTSSYTSPRLSTSSQPYASDFMRKLSANKSVSANTSSASISSKLLDVKESDDEDNGSSQVYTRFTQGGRPTPTIKGRVGKQTTPYQESWLPFDSPISTVLLVIFSLFFVVIGVTYVNMHSTDTNVSSPADIHYPLCSTMEDGIPRVNCIRDVDKEITAKLFNIIYNELHDKLRTSYCSQIGDGPFGMSDIELQTAALQKDPTLGTWITQQQLPNVKILVANNPKLKLIDITGGIAIQNPPLPFYCYIVNNISFAASWFAKLFIVVASFSLVYLGIRYWMKREASHKEEVYKLVSNIIDIVGNRSQGPDGYVPIIHVRDQLIPPQDRQKMEKLWQDAVEVLNSDSRVRCEQQVVEGEDCLVWRWVASSYNSK